MSTVARRREQEQHAQHLQLTNNRVRRRLEFERSEHEEEEKKENSSNRTNEVD